MVAVLDRKFIKDMQNYIKSSWNKKTSTLFLICWLIVGVFDFSNLQNLQNWHSFLRPWSKTFGGWKLSIPNGLSGDPKFEAMVGEKGIWGEHIISKICGGNG